MMRFILLFIVFLTVDNVYSQSASDLLKFSNAFFSGKLLKLESLSMMLEPGLDNYGFGVWAYDLERDDKKYRVVKRPGEIMGSRGMLVCLPAENLSIIILANTDLVNLDDFSYQIINSLIK